MPLEKTILIIGLGNMGKALVKGMLKSGISPNSINAVDISLQAKATAEEFGINLYNKAPDEITPKIIIVAIKPQLLNKILSEYKKFVNPDCVFISIVAGATIAKFEDILTANANIIRTMPNTPASIGCGMTALFANKNINNKQKQQAENLLKTVGETAWLQDESLMDTVTAISGSGPAYFFLIMQELTNAGIKNGLPKDLAQKLVVNTAWGAGNLAKQSNNLSPQQLKEMVTSPNGTTEAGLNVFAKNKIDKIIENVVASAKNKSIELS